MALIYGMGWMIRMWEMKCGFGEHGGSISCRWEGHGRVGRNGFEDPHELNSRWFSSWKFRTCAIADLGSHLSGHVSGRDSQQVRSSGRAFGWIVSNLARADLYADSNEPRPNIFLEERLYYLVSTPRLGPNDLTLTWLIWGNKNGACLLGVLRRLSGDFHTSSIP